jgi:hypothetical protein
VNGLLPALLVVTFAAARAEALPPPSPEALAEAKSLDAAADKLARSGAQAEALAALRRSEELAPRPETLRAIARVQRDMKDFAAAYATLRSLDARFGDGLKKKDREALLREIAELEAITGGLHLVLADGMAARVDAGASIAGPFDATIRANLGVHVVKVEQPGHDPVESKVEIKPGAVTELTPTLAAKPGRLVVRMRGTPTRLLVDGVDVGAPPFAADAKAGVHVIEVGVPPNVTRREALVPPAGVVEVVVDGTTTRTLVIEAPDNAAVFVDGRPKSLHGTWSGVVEEGPHELLVTQEGFAPEKRMILPLEPGETRTERVSLALPPSPPFRGVYGQLSAVLAVSGSANNFVTDACAVRPGCTGFSGAVGVALPGRVGYSFGWFGLEGVAEFRYDQSWQTLTETASSPEPSYTGSFQVHRISIAEGIGVRFSPPTRDARFSMGLGVAHLDQFLVTSANVAGNGYAEPPSAHASAPMLLLDAGVLFGPTPAARLRLALEASFEFIGDPVTDSSQTSVVMTRGTNVFIGPAIGVQFGH